MTLYNSGKQNWPFYKTADFLIKNAINPTNLGAKWKLLLSENFPGFKIWPNIDGVMDFRRSKT